MKWLKDPNNRVKGAWALFFLSLALGTYCTIWISQTPFERVLMAISWGAITITCLDVIATTDVRANEKDK